MTKHGSDRTQTKKLEKIIKETNLKHQHESKDIEKKRLELLSELIKLENKVNKEPQPTISKHNAKSVENQGDLIDTQGSVVKMPDIVHQTKIKSIQVYLIEWYTARRILKIIQDGKIRPI